MSRTRKVSKQSTRSRTAKYAERDWLMARKVSCASGRRARVSTCVSHDGGRGRCRNVAAAQGAALSRRTHRVACDSLHQHLRACSAGSELRTCCSARCQRATRGARRALHARLAVRHVSVSTHAPTLHKLCIALPKSFMPGPDRVSSMPPARRVPRHGPRRGRARLCWDTCFELARWRRAGVQCTQPLTAPRCGRSCPAARRQAPATRGRRQSHPR